MGNINKIRVTFLLPSLECGGAERNTINILKGLNKGKYKLSLALLEKKGDFLQDVPSDVAIIDFNSLHSFKTFFRLMRYFRDSKADIFVSAFTRINIISLLARFFSGSKTKIVVTEHAVFSMLPAIAKTFFRKVFAIFFLPTLSRIIYPLADSIICVSNGVAMDFTKKIGCRSKIKVIYNPVTNNAIKNLAKENITEKEFNSIKTPIVLAVGRLVKCKDYPNLLKAFNRVLKEKPCQLIILGTGPQESKLKKTVAEMGLSESVSFLGFKENPYKYMSKASVFVLSSFQEGFGNVIIEAMACGAPVVSTDCLVGPGEIIQNSINGLLVPPKNAEALAGAILKVLNSPQLAEKFSREGKIRAEYFSVEKGVAEYEKIFKEVLNA